MLHHKQVVIIDYQLGNLFSVKQALTNIGLKVIVSTDPIQIENASALVLPGVGAFGDAMNNLRSMNLIEPIKQFVSSGKPFLGICLGLQLLFSESEEFGFCEGLGLINGKVKRFTSPESGGIKIKIPQITWNKIFKPENKEWKSTPLEGLESGEFVYFVHSYYVEPEENVALTYTTYGTKTYVSSIVKDNIFACQFHPEKSADKGLKIYKNLASLNNLI